jgi:hypothetical protein
MVLSRTALRSYQRVMQRWLHLCLLRRSILSGEVLGGCFIDHRRDREFASTGAGRRVVIGVVAMMKTHGGKLTGIATGDKKIELNYLIGTMGWSKDTYPIQEYADSGKRSRPTP